MFCYKFHIGEDEVYQHAIFGRVPDDNQVSNDIEEKTLEGGLDIKDKSTLVRQINSTR